ncbi:response regulator [Candidatus Bathyarchaeota archaeon]|nr:response regulator [Candidatus Bathyarchaeota archaeon]
MLRKHEDRLDAITKQVIAINRAMESDGVKIQDKLDITGEDAPHEMKSVLVVDDDPNIVKTYKLVLESVGYSVDTARNGIEALFKSKKVYHDLIIIDMNLPDMLGNQLANQIKEEKPDIKIIMITGYSSYMDELDEFNIDEMLMKPIPPEDLVEIAKKTLTTEEHY